MVRGNNRLLAIVSTIIMAVGMVLLPQLAYADEGIELNDRGINDEVWSLNDILFYQKCITEADTDGNSVCGIEVSGNTIEEKIWRGLTSFMTAEQAAGVMGNMAAESGLNPARHETSFINSKPNFDISSNTSTSYGIGLIQWSFGRRVNLYKSFNESAPELWKKYLDEGRQTYGKVSGAEFLKKADDSDANTMIGIELCFLKSEIDKSYKGLLETDSVDAASDYFLFKIERPANPEGTKGKRREAAHKYYDQLKDIETTNDSGDDPPKADDGVPDSNTHESANNYAKQIADTALKLAWDSGSANDPKPEFIEATKKLKTWDSNNSHGSDCGYFVKAVLATVDTKIVKYPHQASIDSMRKDLVSGKKTKWSKYWDVIKWDGKNSKLQSGDVVWWKNGDSQHYYVVAEKGGKLWKVDASWGGCKSCGHWGLKSSRIYKKDTVNKDERYIFRIKGGGTTDPCDSNAAGSKNINATGAALAWPLGTKKSKYTLAPGKVLESVLKSPGENDSFSGTGSGTKNFQIAWIESKMSKNSMTEDKIDGRYDWRYGAYCCGFTAVVVRYSGYDKHFSGSLSEGGYEQVDYARDHSDLWEVKTWNGQKSELQGGDVLVSSSHSWMIVEDEKGDLYRAEASRGQYQFGHIEKYSGSHSGTTYIIRAKHANNSNAGVSVTDGVATSSTTGVVTNSSKGNKDIGASAIKLAWPDTKDNNYKKKPTDEFKKFYISIGGKTTGSEANGRSCDYFAHTAIVYSGLEDKKEFPWSLHDMQPYVEKSSNWQEVNMSNPKKTSEYKSGDLVFFYNSGGWKDREYKGYYLAHVGIYVEDSNGKGHIAQASHANADGTGGYFGVLKDTSNITSSYFPAIRVYRNSGNTKASAECNICSGEEGKSADAGAVSGGLTLAQAKAFMKKYRNLPSSQWKKYNLTGYGCTDGPVANCVSFSNYFVQKYTSYGKAVGGDGGVYAHNLKSSAKLDEGHTPKVYAVFSKSTGTTMCGNHLCGHTGVVLGIDKNKNKIIIGEAGCSAANSWTDAHEYKLSDWTGKGVYYAYAGEIAKMEEIAKDAQ